MADLGKLGDVNLVKIIISIVGIIIWVVLAIVAANMADNRGRSKGGFFALALFINPILAIVLLACLGDVNKHKKVNTVKTVETKPVEKKPLIETSYDAIKSRCSALKGLDNGIIAFLEMNINEGHLTTQEAKELYEEYSSNKDNNPFSQAESPEV